MRRSWAVPGACLLSLCGALATAPKALAYGVTLALDNVTFGDGGTASGTLSVDTYGYVTGSTVVTAAGSVLPGDTFAWPGGAASPALFAGGSILVLVDSTTDGYTLTLDVANPINDSMSGIDPITGGSEECIQFGGCGSVPEFTTRSVVLTGNPSLDVPEPLSIAVLATGVVGLGLHRYRTGRRGA